MDRPNCRRCGQPLDFDHMGGENADEVSWSCNNGRDMKGNWLGPAMSDAEFHAAWERLEGDDVVKLLKYLDPDDA